VRRALLGKLSPDPSSTDFITPPSACAPFCSDQATRRRLLKELLTLDDIGIVTRQRGNDSRGVQIPGADVAGGLGAPSVGLDTSKGKGKVVIVVCSDNEVSSDDDHPPAEAEKVALQRWVPYQRPPSSRVAGPGGCLHAMARLICSSLSRGGTWHILCRMRGGGSFKGRCG
jgi:hypothetical protein